MYGLSEEIKKETLKTMKIFYLSILVGLLEYFLKRSYLNTNILNLSCNIRR